MCREGIRRKYYFDGKKWSDMVYFSAIAENFGIKNRKPTIRLQLGS